MRRPNNKRPYLDDSSALSNFRQYGYVICGQYVEVWEMQVKVHNEPLNEQDCNETMCEGIYFVSPTKLLDILSLAMGQVEFKISQWHQYPVP